MTNYRRKKRNQEKTLKKYNVNEKIKGERFKIIDDQGVVIGVLQRSKAFRLAQEKDLDLIEVDPKGQPPVLKLGKYNKLLYKLKKSSVKQKNKDIKTIKISVNIAENDLKIRADKIKKFLENKLNVKIQIFMRGRENAHSHIAKEKMHKLLDIIGVEFVYQSEPSLVGSSYFTVIKSK